MKTSTTWKHWLKNHEKNEEYMLYYGKINKLLDTDNLSPEGCFDKIDRKLDSLVLLTLSTENNFFCSFCHEKWGNPILDSSLTSICFIGFGERAFATKIETDKVLISSDKEFPVPSWEDIIKIKNKEDLNKIEVSTKRKIKSFALLPPFFTNALLDLKVHEPRDYLFSFIKLIQVGLKNAAKQKDTKQLERAKSCYDIFIFLWASGDLEMKNKELARSKSRSLTSKVFTEWADSMHEKFIINEIDQIDREEVLTQFSSSKTNSNETHDIEKFEIDERSKKSYARNIDKELIDVDADPDVEIPEEISPTSKMNLETIFKNLGLILQDSMDKQSSKETNYEDSQKKKVWKELDINSKECFLNASSKRGLKPASDPEDSLLVIMTKKSPAKILTHLYFVLNRLDIFIVQGLATALSRMILLSTPSWKNISNLSTFFVPPRNSKIATNSNFLRLHVLEQEGKGYDDKDIDSVTTQSPKWPFNITGLRKQIMNFISLCALIFGKGSLLSMSLKSWDDHILDNEQSYEEYQSNHKYFICSVLNKIHQNVQRFLMRCQEGWDKINWEDINFRKIQDRIVTEDYHVEKPAWVVEKDHKNSIDNNHNHISENNNHNGGHRNKRYKLDFKDSKQEINTDKDPRFNIPDPKLKYGEIFTADIRKAFGKIIRNDENTIICHRYHIKGICDSNCKMKESRKKISKGKTDE